MTVTKNIISVKDLNKSFKIPKSKETTLRGTLFHILNTMNYRVFHALKDISFDVKKGEFLSIIGRNGSGKSLLLKIIAGIYKSDSGQISIKETISSFFTYGIGFNVELSARENVILSGILQGLRVNEIENRLEDIVEFAEVQDFIDTQLKYFSSGMKARLAFAVSMQVESPIIILDEIFAVGDEKFRQKSFEVIKDWAESQKTILFVSHNLGMVSKFSDRVLVLDKGELKFDGMPDEAIKFYKENFL